MKKSLIVLSLVAFSASSFASCFGSDSFKTCSDDSGNSYTVRKIGGTTYVDGSNPSTGSNWNQTSRTIGNTTYHDGTASNGNSWSGTTRAIGSSVHHTGIDSNGNFYSKTCNQYGCY